MTPQEVEAKLRKHLEATLKSAEAALYQGASIIMTEAKKRAPLDFGTLRNSGYVTLPRQEGGEVFVEAGFGGAAKSYAVAIHEGFYKREDGKLVTVKPIDVGENKYLQNAIDETEQRVVQRIKSVVSRGLNTGHDQAMGPKTHEENPSEDDLSRDESGAKKKSKKGRRKK